MARSTSGVNICIHVIFPDFFCHLIQEGSFMIKFDDTAQNTEGLFTV